MRKIGKMSPLMILGVIVAVSAMVAAGIILTSNTVSVDQTVRTWEITLDEISPPATILAGEMASYGITAFIPQSLSEITIKLVFTCPSNPGPYVFNLMDDIEFMAFESNEGWSITEIDHYTIDEQQTMSPQTYTMYLHHAGTIDGEMDFGGDLSLTYNRADIYHMEVTLIGTTVE